MFIHHDPHLHFLLPLQHMTREDIIKLAREAGFNVEQGFLLRATGIDEDLERFAALVAAAEREACAKACEDMEEKAEGTECCKWPTPVDCAYAIRARGQS
jgi:hypothetical protein